MNSYLQNLQLRNQEAQDAKAYRAMMRQAEDESLARNAVAKDRQAYANQDMGWGLTRQDVANAMGRPVNEVSADTLDDNTLQALGDQKRLNQAELLRTLNAKQMYNNELTAEDKARQMAMQQAANDMQSGQLGLASRLGGSQRNDLANASAYLNSIPTAGSINMNENSYTPLPAADRGEIMDAIPQDPALYRKLDQRR